MKKIDSDNFLTLVKNYINCNLKQTNYALPMLKGYLMKRPLGKSTKKDYFFDFISHDTNNSIKCIFSKENKESNINIDFYKPFEVHITKYNFDYLTYEKNNVLDYNFLMGIIICEMVAKSSLLTTALISEPLTPGIGSYFIFSTNSLNYALSTIIVAVIAFLLGGIVGLIGLLGAIVSGFLISVIAKRNFGVANGDVLGMSNEVGRLMALIFMSIALYFL